MKKIITIISVLISLSLMSNSFAQNNSVNSKLDMAVKNINTSQNAALNYIVGRTNFKDISTQVLINYGLLQYSAAVNPWNNKLFSIKAETSNSNHALITMKNIPNNECALLKNLVSGGGTCTDNGTTFTHEVS